MSDAITGITDFIDTAATDVGTGISDIATGVGNFLTSGGGPSADVGGAAAAPADTGGGITADVLSNTPAAPTATSAASLGGAGGAIPFDSTQLDPIPSGTPGLGTGDAPGGATGGVIGGSAPGGGITADQFVNAASPPSNSGGGGIDIGRVSSGPTTPGSSLWNDITSGNVGAAAGDIGSVIAKNPGALLAGGGLLYNLLRNNNIPGQGELNAQAGQLSAQGAQLSSYLQKGTLPPGVQTSIQTATKAAQAAVRSKYASMGMSGSTAELQEINAVNEAAVSQGVQIAENLLNTGIQESGLAAGIYENLIKINQAQSQATGSAIANFASALNGTTPGITLKVA